MIWISDDLLYLLIRVRLAPWIFPSDKLTLIVFGPLKPVPNISFSEVGVVIDALCRAELWLESRLILPVLGWLKT